MEEAITSLFADTEFILLESGMRLLNEYLINLNLENKERDKRAVMIKILAKKKITSTILDDSAISALIKEINDFYNKKEKPSLPASNQVKSFKNLIYEENVLPETDLLKNNYIFSSAIIYVDSVKDIKNISNSVYRQFKINEDHSHHIFSGAVDKPKIFENHYNMVRHFLLQNPKFKTKFQENSEGIEISTLDCLLGYTEKICVLGVLTLNEESVLQLQDPTRIVKIDVKECEWGKGYFTQGCVVLAQGYYNNEIFKVKLILHPTYNWLNLTFKEKFENDFFGAITKAFKSKDNINEGVSVKSNFQKNKINEITGNNNSKNNNISQKPEENFLLSFLNKDLCHSKYLFPKTLENMIHNNLDYFSKGNYNSSTAEKIFNSTNDHLTEEFLIVISNPDLTNQNVLNAIDKIISGYNNSSSSSIPFMIIFIGNFTPENSFNSFKSYATIFDNLANIIIKNSHIAKNSYIVFIPGPDEFSLFSGYPKHPIIETVINPLKKKLPNIINATNPCRFSLFGKELVVFRDNLNKKLSRNAVNRAKDIMENKENYITTVLSQGNLSPVDLNVTSQIWHLSQSMNILPAPDILILADVVEDFNMMNNSGKNTNENCKKTVVVNPGNFTKDYSFDIIFPLKGLVEPCKINLS
jgi:hypothetical protein